MTRGAGIDRGDRSRDGDRLARSVEGSDVVLAVEGLAVEFPTSRGWVRVVEDVSFTLDPGRTLGLVGESGSGRPCRGGHPRPDPHPRGRVTGGKVLDGGLERLTATHASAGVRGREIGMIFQEPIRSLEPGVHRRRTDRAKRSVRHCGLAADGRVTSGRRAARHGRHPERATSGRPSIRTSSAAGCASA